MLLLALPLVVIAAVFAVVMGGDDDEPKALEKRGVEVAGPTPLTEACEQIRAVVPEGSDGGEVSWVRVQQEAEHYADSDDPDVRNLAYDLADAVEAVVNAEENGASPTTWDRVARDLFRDWKPIAATCDWPELSIVD